MQTATRSPLVEQAPEEIRAAGVFAAPDLVNVETIAVLHERWPADGLSDRRFASAMDDLASLEFDRYPTIHFVRRAYELRDNVTPYDATYVALAELLGCELLSADRRLATAPGPRCPVRVLE